MSGFDDKLSGVSVEAVDRATGRSWEEWLAFLDGLGARELNHKEIVALVAGQGGLSSGWWQQTVAVGYEQARRLRVVGQTADVGFQVGVQKTLPVSPETAWALLFEGPGRDAWLGDAGVLEWRKGERYHVADGPWGEIRSAVPGRRVRLTWRSAGLARQSTLQVTLIPSGEKTSVRFHQEGLSGTEEREAMRAHWRQTLERLFELAQRSSAGLT